MSPLINKSIKAYRNDNEEANFRRVAKEHLDKAFGEDSEYFEQMDNFFSFRIKKTHYILSYEPRANTFYLYKSRVDFLIGYAIDKNIISLASLGRALSNRYLFCL